MAEVDNTIALRFKPIDMGGPDPVKVMSAISQGQLNNAHAGYFDAESAQKSAMLPATIEHLKAQTEQARASAGLARSQTVEPYYNDPSIGLMPSSTASPSPTSGGGIGGAGAYLSFLGDTERKYGLEPGYLSKTAQVESGFDHRSVSDAGARGVFQFMPATA